MQDTSTSSPADIQVNVQGVVTTDTDGNSVNQNNSQNDDNVSTNEKAEALQSEIRQVKSELAHVKNDIRSMINGEINTIRHYVDQAIEHERLVKRP